MHELLDYEHFDPSLRFERAPELPPERPRPDDDGQPWWMKFYDPDRNKYDWSDPEWKAQNEKNPRGFYPIYLTQGFFMIVSKRDYKRMTTYPDGSPKKWSANVQFDVWGEISKIYAVRRGRGDEPDKVYMHRELTGCLYASVDVDHINGFGLDNRRKNLKPTSTQINSYNTTRHRLVHSELLPGVEKRAKGRDGRQKYGGIRCRRLKKKGKGSVLTIRTKMTWYSQEPANRWYRKQLEKDSGGRTSWAHAPNTVDWPKFPPLMESAHSAKSLQLLAKAAAHEPALADIPF
jgi:hypothetical protein